MVATSLHQRRAAVVALLLVAAYTALQSILLLASPLVEVESAASYAVPRPPPQSLPPPPPPPPPPPQRALRAAATSIPPAATVSIPPAAAAASRRRRREVVVYRRPNVAHKTGGPAGEEVLFRSLITGLRNCDDVELTVSEDASAIAGILRTLGARLHMLFIDQYALDDVLPMRRSDMPLWRATIACRLRLLDYWGTPAKQNWWSLHMHQFLVPFENGYNFRLGFYVAPLPPPRTERKPQGVIWGKEQKYFVPHIDALRKLSETVQLVATVDASRMLSGGGDSHMRDLFASSIRNVGHLSQEGWRNLLQESAFVLGLGDPVIGPTPIEGLAAGCAYLNPVYPSPRQLGQNADVRLRTQHDPLADVGPPAVLDVRLNGRGNSWSFDPPDLVAKATQAVRDRLARPPRVAESSSWLPTAFRRESFMKKLRAVLASDFSSHCLASCSGFIRPKGTTECPPPGGGGD